MGRQKRTGSGNFCRLLTAVPSHDTFRRVFSLVDPEEFEEAFTLGASQAKIVSSEVARACSIGRQNSKAFT